MGQKTGTIRFFRVCHVWMSFSGCGGWESQENSPLWVAVFFERHCHGLGWRPSWGIFLFKYTTTGEVILRKITFALQAAKDDKKLCGLSKVEHVLTGDFMMIFYWDNFITGVQSEYKKRYHGIMATIMGIEEIFYGTMMRIYLLVQLQPKLYNCGAPVYGTVSWWSNINYDMYGWWWFLTVSYYWVYKHVL